MDFLVKRFSELTTTELYEILKARCAVFSVEQKMNCQDLDDVDYRCFHFCFFDKGKAIAYFRAFFTDEQNKVIQIGRCLTIDHGKGLGKALMQQGMEWLIQTYHPEKFVLHAQKQAIGFYEKLGFVPVSNEYLEEGIVHKTMERKI